MLLPKNLFDSDEFLHEARLKVKRTHMLDLVRKGCVVDGLALTDPTLCCSSGLDLWPKNGRFRLA
jgi:hypothetical protein